MINKKFTDEEIKSSLEVIATTCNCNECKLRNGKWGTCNCSQTTANAALDLINRLQAENERLEVENQSLRGAANSLKSALREEQYCTNTIRKQIKTAKSEAYKEFVEKLKEKADIEIFEEYLPSGGRYQIEYKMVYIDDIDDLLKEMAGEEE